MNPMLAAMLSGGAARDNKPHPIRVLRAPSKARPDQITNDARIAAIDESITMLRRRPEKYASSFNGKLDAALADLILWRERMIECQQCETIAELSKLVASCWDSPLVHKVTCPKSTRTGKYARRMFQATAMRQLFLLSHFNLNKETPVGATSVDTPAPESTDSAPPKQPTPEVEEEPLD